MRHGRARLDVRGAKRLVAFPVYLHGTRKRPGERLPGLLRGALKGVRQFTSWARAAAGLRRGISFSSLAAVAVRAAGVCARASARLVKLGITRSIAVSAKTRRTVVLGMTSSTSRPSASARLCAAIRVCSPDESQNRVRVMSTTSVPCPSAPAVSRADRSASALVMSISSGAASTGTPPTTSTGNLSSGICAPPVATGPRRLPHMAGTGTARISGPGTGIPGGAGRGCGPCPARTRGPAGALPGSASGGRMST